jgi:hypothetical protein
VTPIVVHVNRVLLDVVAVVRVSVSRSHFTTGWSQGRIR